MILVLISNIIIIYKSHHVIGGNLLFGSIWNTALSYECGKQWWRKWTDFSSPTRIYGWKAKIYKKNEEPKHHVTLIIGAYVFTRNRKAAGIGKNAKFICNGCKKLGSRTGALAKLIAKNDNQNDYQLMSCDLEHACTPPSVAPLKKKFMSKLYEEVKKNPSKAIGRIYSEIRDEFSNNLSPDEKKQFIRIIPSQVSCT